jgi:hypothetical protein
MRSYEQIFIIISLVYFFLKLLLESNAYAFGKKAIKCKKKQYKVWFSNSLSCVYMKGTFTENVDQVTAMKQSNPQLMGCP